MSQLDIKKYDFIDALRGIAILGVILVHSSQYVAPTSAMLRRVMNEGARGVQLFYVASALTLCMSWIARSSRETFPARNFYIRRFCRIAPMFYIAMLFYIFLNGFSPAYWFPNGIKWWFIPITVTFLHGFHPETINSIVPGGWSIAVEMSFYLILPFVIPRIKSIESCAFFFVISMVLYGLNKLLIPHIFFYPENQQYLIKSFSYLDFLGQLPVFIIGIFAYLIFHEKYPRKQIAIVGSLLFVVFLLLCIYPVSKIPHHIVAGGLFSVFSLLLANWPIRLLVNRVTITLGKLSFSMYLMQFAVLAYFSKLGFDNIFQGSNITSLLHFLCVVLVTAFVSIIFYNYVEKPGIVLGKCLIEKLEHNVVPNTSTEGGNTPN